MPRFTRASALAVTCPAGRAEAFVWDDIVPQLAVRVRAGGARRWVVQWRAKGQQRRVALGDPALVAPERARARAKELLAEVALGRDPVDAERTAAAARRAAMRVAGLVEHYLTARAKDMKPRSLEEAARHLRSHARLLHAMPADTLARTTIINMLDEVEKSAGGVTANRVRSSLSAMFAWAVQRGIVDANPVIGVAKLAREMSRDRVLADTELAAIWRATGTGADHDRIVRLLMLTATRRDEVGRMAWSEVEDELWILPAARSKNGLQHEVPLVPLAMAQMPARPDHAHGAIFGRFNAGFSGWSRCKARLDERIGAAMGTGWTLHDLRRTAATWMHENGVEPHVVEAVLNHASGMAKRGVAGTYNRATYRVQKHEALERWAAHVAKVTGAGQ